MPKPPTVHRYKIPTPDGVLELSCIVIDQSEFNDVCDAAAEKGLLTSQQAAEIKTIGNIPMVMRGTKTEFLFEKFGVEDQRLSMIVRGKGEEVFRRCIGMPNPENN